MKDLLKVKIKNEIILYCSLFIPNFALVKIKKHHILAKRDEIKDLMLLQTNNVTFGKFSISEWQDNILTLINEQLQKHMYGDATLQTDLFGEPYVDIMCDDVGGKNNKAKVINEARELMKKVFSFRWVDPEVHRTVESCGVIITTIHNEVGTNKLRLNFNKWAVPFLLYYGKGVGGTRYSKNIALSLPGDKTKRIYKLICSQQDQTEYYYPIEQFRHDFEISGSYTNATIKKHILNPARDRIKESASPVWFDYEMITRYPKNNGRKPMADTIVFKIKNTKAVHGSSQKTRNNTIYRWITFAMGSDHQGIDAAFDTILASDRTDDFFNRLCYWEDQIAAGEKTTEHVKNSILKVLRDDYGIRPRTEKKKKR